MHTEKPGENGASKERAAYERLRSEVERRLHDVRDRIHAENLRDSFQSATERLRSMGGHTAETINKVAGTLKKDLAHAAHKMGPAWESFSEKTSGVFHVWRDRGGIFLASAASAVRDWLRETTERIENQRYETGEVAYTGTFSCTACDERVVLNAPGSLPKCPACKHTEFRRLS